MTQESDKQQSPLLWRQLAPQLCVNLKLDQGSRAGSVPSSEGRVSGSGWDEKNPCPWHGYKGRGLGEGGALPTARGKWLGTCVQTWEMGVPGAGSWVLVNLVPEGRPEGVRGKCMCVQHVCLSQDADPWGSGPRVCPLRSYWVTCTPSLHLEAPVHGEGSVGRERLAPSVCVL